MKSFLNNIQIKLNETVYLKNPESSDLGKKIIMSSVELIDTLGFENFTFKKLAIHINSTEASVYRYFESKHQLLVYLSSWYWGWQEYQLVFGLANIDCSTKRLQKAIQILIRPVTSEHNLNEMNLEKISRISIQEFSKIYLNKHVDVDNKMGYFLPFKNVVQRLSDIVLEINPSYKYPHMLISTIIEGARQQRFFAEHLPRLTNSLEGEDAVKEFYTDMVIKSISKQ